MRYDDLSALSPVVRKEVLTGELSRRIKGMDVVSGDDLDSVVNAMVSYGASTFRIMLKSVTWKWLVREHRGVHGNPTSSKG